MYNPKPLIVQSVAVLVTASTLLYGLRGSNICYDRVIHPEKESKCACRDNITGTDGTCDSSSTKERYHEYCDKRAEGYWFCSNRSVEVGWQATCTTEVNWTQWTKCYLLGGATCVAACQVSKMSLACMACLAKFSMECFGCRIRYCQEGQKFPLRCLQAEPGFPAVEGCPYFW